MVELRNLLAQELGGSPELQDTALFVFDLPTPRLLAEWLAAELGVQQARTPPRGSPRRESQPSPSPSPSPSPLQSPSPSRSPLPPPLLTPHASAGAAGAYPASENEGEGDLVVIGAACRLPGGADSPEAFWELLCYGMRRGAHAAARAALSLEAERMDPQQRVALEVSLDALVGAGLVRAGGSGRARRAATDQAHRRLRGSSDARLVGYGGTAGGILCHRAAREPHQLPYVLGLTGPAL